MSAGHGVTYDLIEAALAEFRKDEPDTVLIETFLQMGLTWARTDNATIEALRKEARLAWSIVDGETPGHGETA